MDEKSREKLLSLPPKGKILRTVIDTDARNEVDDIYAIAWAVLSPERLNVEAVYAEPFLNFRSASVADGMAQSYQEIKDVIGVMHRENDIKMCRGAVTTYTKTRRPVPSPAVSDLLDRARDATADEPLYILALGPVTNIVSAMIMDPSIIDRIVIVWQGCGVPEKIWMSGQDCNVEVDIEAARYMLNSGAAIIQVPGNPVTSHLLTSYWELQHYLDNKNDLCKLLLEHFKNWVNEWGIDKVGWTKSLWDIGAVAVLVSEDFCRTRIIRCPVIPKGFGVSTFDLGESIVPEHARRESRYDPEFPETEDIAPDAPRHRVRAVYQYARNLIYADMLRKLSGDQFPNEENYYK